MFETVQAAPPDSILGLNEAFQKDDNPDKINLSVGVYKDDLGQTPILSCVKDAERLLLDEEATKGYLGIDGYPQLRQQVPGLLLAQDHPAVASGSVACLQTPGGTGALRVAADLLSRQFPKATIWCSTPTWPNHPTVFGAAGLRVDSYPYLDANKTGLDFEAMAAKLSELPEGDVVCLHASCHNPSGVDPTPEQWNEIGRILSERKLLPLIDCAYQGFGNGIEEDVQGVRALCGADREALICNSFSKNFGLYGERIGALSIVTRNPETAQAMASNAKACVRANYSNPPKHGGAVVATILADAGLKSTWLKELAGMRERIHEMRTRFVGAMAERVPDRDFSFIERQLGMFSFSGLTPMQVDRLRTEYSIYIVGSGRINVAGITSSNLNRLCDSIAEVL